MNRGAFRLLSVLVPLAVSLVTLGSALASTPGTIAKFDDFGNPTADSVITENATGNIGVGTSIPQNLLHVGPGTSSIGASRVNVVIASGSTDSGIAIAQNNGVNLMLQASGVGAYLGTTSNHPLVWRTNDVDRMSIGPGGGVRMLGLLGTRGLDPDSGYPAGIAGGVHTWDVYAEGLVGVGQNGTLTAYMRNDGVGAFRALDVAGMVKASVVQITGADFSEKFDVRETKGRLEPGKVVAIDPGNPGKLVLSTTAYDRRVAGILSGAGGINAGMLMGQPGTLADGDHPVALSGRVYVWADASNGPIVPGDLLTTSNVPGHAMKVTNHSKASGATLGKAMTGLSNGRGLVLTLVTLQ
jgi:hypothetical protein